MSPERAPSAGSFGSDSFSQRFAFMSSLTICCIVFACTLVGIVLGVILRALLHEKHFSAESKDLIKLSMGLVGTLTALVLGLLIASAKSSFDTQRIGLA